MIFQYQALDRTGKTVTDYLDAPSEMSARQKIRGQGMYLTKIKKQEISTTETADAAKTSMKALFQRLSDVISLKLSTKQIGIFSRQLATLLRAGLPLPVAIADIVEQIDNKHFRNVIADVKEKIEQGSSFSNALSQHRSIFPEMYISMVRVGENLGSLDQVIARLAELEEKQNILTSKIRSALWYPAFMMLFAMAVMMFLMTSVIPAMANMFEEQKQDLPFVTTAVLAVSNFLSHFWYVPLLLFALLVYLYGRYSKSAEGRRKIDELKLKLPLVSNLYRRLIVYRFTQNLGILLSNKVDIIKSFEIVKKIVGNVIIEKSIEDASARIKEGATVSNALAKSEFLPKLVLGMISAGEASDNLDSMLVNIGTVYETELDLTVTSLTSLLEPIIIILMGLIIGLIVMAVILPITQMNMLLQ